LLDEASLDQNVFTDTSKGKKSVRFSTGNDQISGSDWLGLSDSADLGDSSVNLPLTSGGESKSSDLNWLTADLDTKPAALIQSSSGLNQKEDHKQSPVVEEKSKKDSKSFTMTNEFHSKETECMVLKAKVSFNSNQSKKNL
jgi:hypothetical protein